MTMIRLITCTNKTYFFKHMKEWMDYARNYNPELPKPIMVCIDFKPSDIDIEQYSHIDFRPVSSSNFKAMNSNFCIQHGDFLCAIPEISDEETLIIVDGDCLIQRPLTTEDIEYLQNYKFGEVGMNWNNHPGDTLHRELISFCETRNSRIFDRWCKDYPCFNAGVIVAKKSTFHSYFNKYVELWPEISNDIRHIARQQLLLSHITMLEPFCYKVLSSGFHNHGHFGLFKGTNVDNLGDVYFEGQKAFLRHKICWNNYTCNNWKGQSNL